MKNKPALSQFSLRTDPVPWPSLNFIAEFRITAASSMWTLGSLFMGLEPFPGGVFCSFNGDYMKYVIFSGFCIHGRALSFQASGIRPRRLAHLGEDGLTTRPPANLKMALLISTVYQEMSELLRNLSELKNCSLPCSEQ